MNNEKADQKLPTDAELSDRDLGDVTGGSIIDYIRKYDGVKGESKDDTHKDTIHIESYFRKP